MSVNYLFLAGRFFDLAFDHLRQVAVLDLDAFQLGFLSLRQVQS
jgi:hypothetical protein